MSSALVSGVAALLLERRSATTPAELKRLLMTTATPLGTGAQAAAFGAGEGVHGFSDERAHLRTQVHDAASLQKEADNVHKSAG